MSDNEIISIWIYDDYFEYKIRKNGIIKILHLKEMVEYEDIEDTFFKNKTND